MLENETTGFDRWIHDFFKTSHWAALDGYMRTVTFIGGSVGLTVALVGAIGFFWARGRTWPQAGILAIDGLGGFGLIEIAKHALYRARPEIRFDFMGSSFPSGHAFDAVSVYGLIGWWLALEFPRHRWPILGGFAFLVFSIGISRILLGVHYPADVAGGALLGLPWLFTCVAMGRAVSDGAGPEPRR
jgi:undecaprenyl-diphosphatase